MTADDSTSHSDSGFVFGDPSREIDLDAALEKAGGEVAARWRRTMEPLKVERRKLSEAEKRLQAIRHGELSGEELQAEVVAALTTAESLLSETPIDGVLASHGWSERLASTISTRLAVMRAMAEDGRYRGNSTYSELGRMIIEEIDPRTEDALTAAVYECQSLLRAASRRSHPE